MNTEKKAKALPFVLILIFLAGISGFISHLFLNDLSAITDEALLKYHESKTVFDEVSPIILNVLLLVSAIFVSLKKVFGVKLMLIYILSVIVSHIIHSLTTLWFAQFGIKGLISSLISLSIMVTIYIYFKHLQKIKYLN